MTDLKPILLLRDVPEERRLSMERYADALEHGLRRNPTLRVEATTVHGSLRQDGALATLSRYLTNYVRYPLHARKRAASVFHIVDHGYAHLAAVLPREKTVVTCHDLMPLLAEEGIAGIPARRRTVMRFKWSISYLRRVAHVICVSQATASDVRRLCRVPSERITVVPNGIDEQFRTLPSEVKASIRKVVLPREDCFMVLHVCSSGGFSYKNVPMTLKVTSSLVQRGLDVVLVRVGRLLAPEERLLATELGIGSRVVDLGHVADRHLVEIYNASDVLLYPSQYEGFGWPPLEAMACGTPVVSSNAPALAEIIEGAGLMAPADNREQLATHVADVLTSPVLTQDLREKGLKRAAGYTWQKAVAGVEEIYARVWRADKVGSP